MAEAGGPSDAGRVSELLGYGLITSGVFLAIVVYNIIAATFPYFPSNNLFAYVAINVVALVVPLNVAASAVEIFPRSAKAMPAAPPSTRTGWGSQIMGLAVGLLYVLPMLGAHLLLVVLILAALGIFVLSVPLKSSRLRLFELFERQHCNRESLPRGASRPVGRDPLDRSQEAGGDSAIGWRSAMATPGDARALCAWALAR